jgi:CelD/BcsL family acetyltransferase involved in cellulose biosynthesis
MGHLQFRVYERREDRSEALPLLDRFFALLTERFEEDKRQYNFYVTSHGQDFIRNVVTDLLGAGVILFVWTLDGVPISFSLCYVVDKRLIYVVPAYDSAFSKCGLGLLHLWKTVAWSFDHGFEILDLSKGTAPYKHLWANDSTWLSLYILPLSPSTRDLAVAKLLHIAFRVVSGLRRHGVSTTLKRVRFKLAPLFQLRSVAVGRSARATDRQTPESSTPGVRMHYPDLADQCLDVRRRAVDAAFHAASGRVTSSR